VYPCAAGLPRVRSFPVARRINYGRVPPQSLRARPRLHRITSLRGPLVRAVPRTHALLVTPGVLAIVFFITARLQVVSFKVMPSLNGKGAPLVSRGGGGGDLIELRAAPQRGQPPSALYSAPPPLRVCVVLFGLAGDFYYNDSLQTQQTPWHNVFGADNPAVDVFYDVQAAIADVGPRAGELLPPSGVAVLGAGLLARGSRRVIVSRNPQDSTAEAAYRVVRTNTSFLVPAGDYAIHRF
jgi:hypothetical protein